jgi:hypothetical protein
MQLVPNDFGYLSNPFLLLLIWRFEVDNHVFSDNR